MGGGGGCGGVDIDSYLAYTLRVWLLSRSVHTEKTANIAYILLVIEHSNA